MLFYFKNKLNAQSLLEILVSISLGIIIIGSSAVLITLALKISKAVKQHFQAALLLREGAEVIQMFAYNNWHSLYDLSKDTDYKLVFSSRDNSWSIEPGQEISVINEIPYKRYFRVYNVNRDSSGEISELGNSDPATQKITIFIEYGNNYLSSSTLSFYLTRFYSNRLFHQTDWSGGGGQEGPVSQPRNRFAIADSNINYLSIPGSISMINSTTTPATLISSILDTGVEGGASFNSLLWQGNLGNGGIVQFQVAFSNSSSGPWVYYGPTSQVDYYQPNPGVSVSFPTSGESSPQNYRYIRYKVYLSTSSSSPQIDDIIINWTP